MKKLFLITIGIVFLANYMIGQEYTRSGFHFGIKAGGNYANVYDAQGDMFRADSKFGFAGGVFMSIPLGEVFGFQPELLYSQKGFKAEGNLLGNNYGLTRTTNWIDVPLLLAIKPMSSVTLLAGPQLSYLLQRNDVLRSAAGSEEQSQAFKLDNIRKNVLGVVGGLDININRMAVGARAGWDLSTNNGDGSSQTPRYKNAWVQGTLGYRFL